MKNLNLIYFGLMPSGYHIYPHDENKSLYLEKFNKNGDLGEVNLIYEQGNNLSRLIYQRFGFLGANTKGHRRGRRNLGVVIEFKNIKLEENFLISSKYELLNLFTSFFDKVFCNPNKNIIDANNGKPEIKIQNLSDESEYFTEVAKHLLKLFSDRYNKNFIEYFKNEYKSINLIEKPVKNIKTTDKKGIMQDPSTNILELKQSMKSLELDFKKQRVYNLVLLSWSILLTGLLLMSHLGYNLFSKSDTRLIQKEKPKFKNQISEGALINQMRYVNESTENGFVKYYLDREETVKIASLKSDFSNHNEFLITLARNLLESNPNLRSQYQDASYLVEDFKDFNKNDLNKIKLMFENDEVTLISGTSIVNKLGDKFLIYQKIQ